jgi:hypothetical protein
VHIAEIIIGALLCVIFVFTIFFALEEKSVIAFGAAVVLAAVGATGCVKGTQGINAGLHAKHVAIFTDINRQGFKVPSDQVYADGGYLFGTTEVDLKVGSCLIPTIARKLGGVWRIALPRVNGNGVIILTPTSVSALCP